MAILLDASAILAAADRADLNHDAAGGAIFGGAVLVLVGFLYSTRR